MKRAKGATLAEIMAATEWQPHTVRGFVSILGSKGGEKIDSSKNSARPRIRHRMNERTKQPRCFVEAEILHLPDVVESWPYEVSNRGDGSGSAFFHCRPPKFATGAMLFSLSL